MHLNGAKSLIHPWREEALGCDDFASFHIIMIDIYGTTTAPSTMLNRETKKQHQTYAKIVGLLAVDPLTTLIPVPVEVINATVAINIHRVTKMIENVDPQSIDVEGITKPSAILQDLQTFDPEQWAHSLASENARSARSWVLLATCYATAATLYFFQSNTVQTSVSEHRDSVSEDRQTAHRACIVAITEILHQKEQKGTHYKFILWPMIICGIESAALGERLELQFLLRNLESNHFDLGTNAYSDGCEFLKEIWERCEQLRTSKQNVVHLKWNDVCSSAPIFLV